MENSVSHNPEDVQAACAAFIAEKEVNLVNSNASNNNNNSNSEVPKVIPPPISENVEIDKEGKLIYWKTDKEKNLTNSAARKASHEQFDPNDPEGVL